MNNEQLQSTEHEDHESQQLYPNNLIQSFDWFVKFGQILTTDEFDKKLSTNSNSIHEQESMWGTYDNIIKKSSAKPKLVNMQMSFDLFKDFIFELNDQNIYLNFPDNEKFDKNKPLKDYMNMFRNIIINPYYSEQERNYVNDFCHISYNYDLDL